MKRETMIRITDLALLGLGIIIMIAIITSEPPKSPEYIPDAVRGLTTLASILIGFTGFCMSYMVSNFEDTETKKWLKNRVPFIVLIIGVSLFQLLGAYTDLVNGNLVGAYKEISIGVLVIIVLFVDTVLLALLLFSVED